jgi:hypothetical protein
MRTGAAALAAAGALLAPSASHAALPGRGDDPAVVATQEFLKAASVSRVAPSRGDGLEKAKPAEKSADQLAIEALAAKKEEALLSTPIAVVAAPAPAAERKIEASEPSSAPENSKAAPPKRDAATPAWVKYEPPAPPAPEPEPEPEAKEPVFKRSGKKEQASLDATSDFFSEISKSRGVATPGKVKYNNGRAPTKEATPEAAAWDSLGSKLAEKYE